MFLTVYASGAIAPTGQIDAHVPHEIHLLGSITHLPSGPVDIAHTGHIPIHVWHPIHLFGSILYAIFFSLNFYSRLNRLNRYWNIAMNEIYKCSAPKTAN